MNKEQLKAAWPKGCPRPMGYADFFDWVKAQEAHGLKQKQCPTCLRWKFPQEECDPGDHP